jgi:hypothetical protein
MKVICVYSARNDTSFMGDLGLADENPGDDHRPAALGNAQASRRAAVGLQVHKPCKSYWAGVGGLLSYGN